MTVRNGHKTLEAALDSICNQTMTNWEAVIVDDGSTDSTASILASYANKDPRFKSITTQGIGRGHALNLALKSAAAELIANLDADDLCHPERLEIQAQVMEKRSDISLLSTRHVVIGAGETPGWQTYNGQSGDAPFLDLSRLLLLVNVIDHSSVMFRKQSILAIGGYDAARRWLFDYELWLRLLENKLSVHEIGLVLAAKRIHADQSFERHNRWAYLLSAITLHYKKFLRIRPPLKYWVAPLARLAWAAMPTSLRSMIGRHLKSTDARA